jgi:hypothetical protein
MHRSVLTLAAAALVLAGCDSTPTSPAPVPAAPSFARGGDPGNDGTPDREHIRTEYTRTVTNPCGPVPEPVVVTGIGQYHSHFKFFEGGNDSRLMGHSQMSGVGSITGTRYSFHELAVTDGHYTYADQRWETEQMTRYHVISQSSASNFFSTVRMKVVYTPTSITTEVVSMETDCRG